jgi:hypothetical protein
LVSGRRPRRGDLERVLEEQLAQVRGDPLAQRQADAVRVVDEQPQAISPHSLHEQHFDLRLGGGEALLDVGLEWVRLHVWPWS